MIVVTPANGLNGNQTVPSAGSSEQEIASYMAENDLTSFKQAVDIDVPWIILDTPEGIERTAPVITDVFQPASSTQMDTRGFGVGTVTGRVVVWQQASGGLYEKKSVSGFYTSLAGVALGFIPGVAAMTVSAILGVLSLGTASISSVKAKTFVSYKYLYRDGKGKWSSDPDKPQYWHLGYRTGQLQTYKHIWASTLNKKTSLWTTRSHDFPTAAKKESSPNYNSSNVWLMNKARSYVTSGSSYIETSW